MKKLRLREVRSLSKVYKCVNVNPGHLTAWCFSQFLLLFSNQPIFYRIHSILILNDLLSWIAFPRRKIYNKKDLTLIPSIVISSYTFYDKFLPSYYFLLTSPSSPIPVKLLRSKESPKMNSLQRERDPCLLSCWAINCRTKHTERKKRLVIQFCSKSPPRPILSMS